MGLAKCLLWMNKRALIVDETQKYRYLFTLGIPI